jgi:hypothetical protein
MWQNWGRTPFSDNRISDTHNGGIGSVPQYSLMPRCFAQTVVASHFSATAANLHTRAVQGRRRQARTRRWSSIPTTARSLPAFSGGGSWAEPLGKTAHRRIPGEGVRFRASLSCCWSYCLLKQGIEAISGFRLHPLVPGLFWFRARVILLADGPTRPTQRLPVPGKPPTFPHPEPPLLFSFPALMHLNGRRNRRQPWRMNNDKRIPGIPDEPGSSHGVVLRVLIRSLILALAHSSVEHWFSVLYCFLDIATICQVEIADDLLSQKEVGPGLTPVLVGGNGYEGR